MNYRKTVAVPVKSGSRDHRHSNQRVIDSLSTNKDDRLLFNGMPIVDTKLLEQSLTNRDLLLLPYMVASYSTYLSLSTGLPKIELFTFSDEDPIDPEKCLNCDLSQYNCVLDTSSSNAYVITEAIPVESRYRPDKKPRKLWVSMMPSYTDVLVEIRLDGEEQWYSIDADRELIADRGFTSIQVRLSFPRAKTEAEKLRTLYSFYILYK